MLNKPYNPQQVKEFVDYNNVVDDILQISPPYHTDSTYKPKYTPSQQTNSQQSIIPSRKRVKNN
jgi:hypothetical protein